MNNPFSYCMLAIFTLLLISNVSVHAQSEGKKRVPFKLQSSARLKKMLENPRRMEKQQPDRVIAAFGVKKGEYIADIGAGTGFHAFRLADKVGVTGKVYAVELQDELLKFMRDSMKKKNVKNLVLVKSSESNPNLPPQSCDKILVANTYYYLQDPVKFMSQLRKALKPEGRMAIIDLDATKISKKYVKNRRATISPDELIAEMKQAGFQFIESFDFLDTRFFLVFSAIQ